MNKHPHQIRFGQALSSHRKKQGLSQEQLAFNSGLDRSYIGGVERGERNISLINMYKLADALQIKVADFFTDADND
ncbi:transcriptional regulator [Moraxella caviae]|uniref:Transcriptional regulator n=1 Tax=Moraxella caviae TaxID=34060 RepID=A0A1S9ZYP4_9GAMM|nr:helix-turn-helix transcriptional regulator [Moraxella caviae]OOR88622.1 transcriptional regulator [Moraxella caviae]STZ13695.1 anaerobic benzoate catabolism transcriptional regulator [Moraxella caviae]